MFGLPKLSGKTQTTVGIAAAAAAFLALSSGAQAQECVGGYRMLKAEVPIACQGHDGSAARAMFSPARPAPLHIGSINRSEQPADATRPSDSPATASTNSDAMCVNGMRFVATPNNGATLMMKCG